MKNLRGRPRNISESGIVYLDSDSEDSEYSDSDVEPIFFPLAGLDLEVGDGFDIEESDVEEEPVPPPVVNNHHPVIGVGDLDVTENHVILQYFGGTVEVRHIVHENYARLPLVRMEDVLAQGNNNNSSSEEAPSTSSSSNSESTTATQTAISTFINVGEEGASTSRGAPGNSHSEDSSSDEGEPPSISESRIVIQLQEVNNTVMEDANGQQVISSGGNSASLEEATPEEVNSNQTLVNPDSSSTVSVLSQSQEGPATSSASGLVPYPDLPDYASAGEEEEEDDRKYSRVSSTPDEGHDIRQSMKRKIPDESAADTGEDGENDTEPEMSSRKTMKNYRELSDDEETCNPMASDVEEFDEAEEAFRGDRIGSTTYSERHVLKILMKWVEELPHYSVERLMQAKENDESEEAIEQKILRLDKEFEEQMSLLWDMSAETDVMKFLVDNKIFVFIRDTLDRSACNRLIEVALGILANVISDSSIIDDFTVHDGSMQLVERVVDLCSKVSNVAVLIQVFSVLRRIAWYLRNVGSAKKWTDLLQSVSFLECANFIMSSSRNVLLLGNVIMLFFTVLESLSPENDETDRDEVDSDFETKDNKREDENGSRNDESKQLRLSQAFEPFCRVEFVPALCEGLNELLKDPKPPNNRRNNQLTSTREREKPAGPSNCPTDDHVPNVDDIDIPIPDGHVQKAILNGLAILALLQKASNGQDTIRKSANLVISFLLNLHRKFTICTEAVTRSNSLEYFALSLHLLSFSHTSMETVDPDAIVCPVSTASKLIVQEERDKEVDMVIRVQLKDGVEFDSVSYVALVVHEYLAAVAEKFGPDATLKIRKNESHAKLFTVLDKVVAKFTEENYCNKVQHVVNNKDEEST